MVWRIHFTADDLARIQVSPTLGPLAETVMAVSLLRSPAPSRALLSEWSGQVRGKITPRMRPLTALIPPGTKGVDLCTLTGEAPTIEQGIQALLAVPREHLLVEMGYTDRHIRLSPAAWALAETGEQAGPGRGDPGRLPSAGPAVLDPDPRLPARRTGCPPPDAGPRGRAGCSPRCRTSGSAGGRRSWRSWCRSMSTCIWTGGASRWSLRYSWARTRNCTGTVPSHLAGASPAWWATPNGLGSPGRLPWSVGAFRSLCLVAAVGPSGWRVS